VKNCFVRRCVGPLLFGLEFEVVIVAGKMTENDSSKDGCDFLISTEPLLSCLIFINDHH
jgi:hypothetical protein